MVVKQNSSVPVVQWIVSNDNGGISLPELSTKDVYFFKKCVFKHMVISVGDFVLISNADSAEPDTVAGCDIARISYLYEVDATLTKDDPYRAIVQWYSRPQAVPHKVFDDDSVYVDFDKEVIEDHRPFHWDVSIETIFSKCLVLYGSLNDCASTILDKSHKSKKFNEGPMFVCRYKFIKVKATYKLIPLEYKNKVEEIVPEKAVDHKRSGTHTPKSAKKSRQSEKTKTPTTKTTTPLKERKPSNKLQEIEFLDVNKINYDEDIGLSRTKRNESELKNTVSPIRIIGNVVVKLSRLSDKKELNGNYLTSSPQTASKNNTPLNKVIAVRRNLNKSIDNDANSTTDSDVLNYSIVNEDPSTPFNDPLKIKLRLSEKQKSDTVRVTRRLSQASLLKEDVSSPKVVGRPRSERKRSVDINNPISAALSTPKKSKNDPLPNTPCSRNLETPRRKSILKTPGSKSAVGTPKRNILLSNIVEERVILEGSVISTPTRKSAKKSIVADQDQEIFNTPHRRKSTSRTQSTPDKSQLTPSQKLKLIRSGEIAPAIDVRRKSSSGVRKSELQMTRERLHVSAVPQCLPCREAEYKNIYAFVEGKIQDQCSGCMYVSGVPGTGKTATVTGVIRALQKKADNDEILPFEYVEINGMRLTEPRRAYVEIYKKLTGRTVTADQAQSLLEKRFSTPAPHRVTTVLVVDELDILCNRRQDVVYNLVDWPTKSPAHLVVITIANTMDLPERLLMAKVASRLGLTRLTFQPYTHKQLQEIVTTRICGSNSFKSDAVQLIARKVASVSGDARRALDICRRATEIAEGSGENGKDEVVNMLHVQKALEEMITSVKVQAIKKCSRLEQIFLQAIVAENERTGIEETNFLNVYSQFETISGLLGVKVPPPGHTLRICSKLGSQRLLISEHSRADIYQKILLNVGTDDIHYALQVQL